MLMSCAPSLLCCCVPPVLQLSEKASAEAALQGRENQLKEELSKKVTEQQQLINIVEVISRQKEDLEGGQS